MSRPTDSYFQHPFSQGKNNGSEASVLLSHNPPPGSVTFIVPTNDSHAQDGLKQIGTVNKILNKPTTVYTWDTENTALTMVTADPPHSALFMARHLEDTGVLQQGATKGLEHQLAKSNHLHSEQPVVAEAKAAPAAHGQVTANARHQVEQIRGTLTALATNTTTHEHDPVREKATVERGVQRETGPGARIA